MIFTGVIGLMTFVGAIMGIIAFFQMRRVKKKLFALEQKLNLLQATPASSANPAQESAQPETTPPSSVGKTTPKVARTTKVSNNTPAIPTSAAKSAATSAAMPEKQQSPASEPPKQRDIGFEEQIGTRWSVWLGGLTLVLGGIFLVHYSISSCLVSSLVRIILAALFAVALFGREVGHQEVTSQQHFQIHIAVERT